MEEEKRKEEERHRKKERLGKESWVWRYSQSGNQPNQPPPKSAPNKASSLPRSLGSQPLGLGMLRAILSAV